MAHGRGQHACCGHRLHKGACVLATHLPLCNQWFSISVAVKISPLISACGSLKKEEEEETTNRLGFPSPLAPPPVPSILSWLILSLFGPLAPYLDPEHLGPLGIQSL